MKIINFIIAIFLVPVVFLIAWSVELFPKTADFWDDIFEYGKKWTSPL